MNRQTELEFENRVLRKALTKEVLGSSFHNASALNEAYRILDSNVDREKHIFLRFHSNSSIRWEYFESIGEEELRRRDIEYKISAK